MTTRGEAKLLLAERVKQHSFFLTLTWLQRYREVHGEERSVEEFVRAVRHNDALPLSEGLLPPYVVKQLRRYRNEGARAWATQYACFLEVEGAPEPIPLGPQHVLIKQGWDQGRRRQLVEHAEERALDAQDARRESVLERADIRGFIDKFPPGSRTRKLAVLLVQHLWLGGDEPIIETYDADLTPMQAAKIRQELEVLHDAEAT